MASFPIQSQQYDGAAIEAKILDLEAELGDETALRTTLDASTADKILAAQQFLADNADLIQAQHDRLKALDTQIRDAVTENEQLEADDTQYQTLVTSAPYTDLATKIAEINAISTHLVDFLVSRGRRGRPPV